MDAKERMRDLAPVSLWQGGGEGGGDRWSVVSMEGGRQHGMEAGGKAGQEAWWKLEG